MRLIRGNKQQLIGIDGAVVGAGAGGDGGRQQRGGGAWGRQQHN
jgi:hypothetical protein